ncbi:MULTISPECIES: inositol 2-dehydrogenase [Photobacterium]|uniref:Inositol 2-dehydrogenase n=1 Tax=Photobacterium ganghwense TaxID=320778 RepID=A0A0J1HFU1_9GAMM|nr:MULTISPECIES: inositol 2-dehydrogenase [Photobacterium]KLV10480.1 inositol 2-dehydrogenase [Photobacterium ganghwense]MBV1841280.1 inositol 2-dehydrogenase [Photobacterium ganghwense]PSU09620.1 inositol 2-dehydrogenase [Photobacterium ganghwense]QSV16868.1 inositol 2-dehydrogenase [Photobacterium ganghwense]
MYNIALFGAGRIGQVHAVNIADHKETQLYSVIDPFSQGTAALAEKYGAKQQSTEEALADPNVHGVLIASATDTHAELIELAAKAGKAIFCEKPVHLDIERVRSCLAIVEQYQVPLFVGFNRRYDPQFRKVREMLSAGSIGKAESLLITSRDPSPPPAEYVKVSGGMFRDMTIHDFDMARFIMGEDPVSIYAQGSNLVDPAIGQAGDIDTAFIVMKFPSGAMATITNSRRSGYGYDQRIELHGEKGLLTAKNIHENAVEQWGEAGCVAAKPEHFFLQRYDAAYKAEWTHFVDVLAGRAQPECSGYDGELALLMADKALESLKTGKEVKL